MKHIVDWGRTLVGIALFGISTLAHVSVLLFVALLKALVRIPPVRRLCDRLLIGIAENWIALNSWMIRTLTGTRLHVQSETQLRYDGHYLVLVNHQSWVDIPILHAIFNRRIPFMRFFLKSQLFWVPLLGLAWWALDFPFMKRYSRATLAKRPELAGRDMQTTRRACEKFRGIPVSILIFAEGTRFTPAKHDQQRSPYRHLLRPKAGGVAFVLEAMGDALHRVLDVTLVYPGGRPTFSDLFTDRLPEVHIDVREHPVPTEIVAGDYERDPAARERAQTWINELWRQKDERIASLRAGTN